MEFTTQDTQTSANKNHGKAKGDYRNSPGWVRAVWVVLLFSATVVVGGILSLLFFVNPGEQKYVDSSKFQALYLNNQEVYFGKIKTINARFIDLQDVFSTTNPSALKATQSAKSATTTALSIVKPDCNAYGSYDEMIIARGDVRYWQNLRPDSQVVQAINAREHSGTDSSCSM